MNCVMRALGREGEVNTVGVVVSLGTGATPLETVESVDHFRNKQTNTNSVVSILL